MSDKWQSLADGLAEVVTTTGASVVRIEGRRRIPASGLVWSADGVIVTAHHVVERPEKLRVGLAGGTVVEAELIGRDPTTDLAALRLSGGNLTPFTPADPAGLRVGQLALALARPGQSVQASLGIIAALGDEWRTGAGGKVDRYVQADLVMYPGFSGGPLVNAAGQVVGLNSSALGRGRSLALPLATVERVVQALLSHGRVRQGYLGISTQPVRLPESIREQLGQRSGLLISAIEPGSPAEEGGLLLGDTIVAGSGAPIRHYDDLLFLLAGDQVGTAVPVRVLRGGHLEDVTVTIGERP